ncbi:peptidase inhibitor family I36 protein [Fodinicola acaciae]|uniref:peptidase inhibitor family I36 protein n=1 Tax=Fodinicola acaciae TaxID=2681555 RepID=UPI0013D70DCC|nr:peptidase inhibitor family I36 protein [Fodinicola acaciae]
MRMRHLAAALAGALALTAALSTTATPAAAAAPAGESFLAAHGINPATLAPGWKVDGQRVVWDNGSVILSPAVYGLSACDPGYVCLYETDNYNTGPYDHNKRMLQFNTIGYRNMYTYGFNDQMSSWYNRRGLDARWYYDDNKGGTSRCMGAGAKVAVVGAADNDKLSSLLIYSTSTAC